MSLYELCLYKNNQPDLNLLHFHRTQAQASKVCSGSQRDQEAVDEMDQDQVPLDLSNRDQVKHSQSEGTHTADNTQNEMPLNLCIKTRPSSPAPNATKTHSPAPQASILPSPTSGSKTQRHHSDKEHSDQRQTAAFALCQLACSSSKSLKGSTARRSSEGPVCPTQPTIEPRDEPSCTAKTRLSVKRTNQAQDEATGESKAEAPKRTGKKMSAKQPSHVPKKRHRCS